MRDVVQNEDGARVVLVRNRKRQVLVERAHVVVRLEHRVRHPRSVAAWPLVDGDVQVLEGGQKAQLHHVTVHAGVA
jgi:hypothetical protein